MKLHHFTIILTESEESEQDAASLFVAGCDDGSISTSDGVTRIDFHRESASLEQAIQSAIRNIRSAGFEPKEVLIEPQSLAEAG
jgi:hypothetical protein